MSDNKSINNAIELSIDNIRCEKRGMSRDKLSFDDADIYIGKKPITIYVIYHNTFENTNVFTTNHNKIPYIVKKLAEHFETDVKEWQYREIPEEQLFCAAMDDF